MDMVGPLYKTARNFNQLDIEINGKIAVANPARREQFCPNNAQNSMDLLHLNNLP
jgi:hypothetical protein